MNTYTGEAIDRARRIARGEERGHEIEPGIFVDDATLEALIGEADAAAIAYVKARGTS